MSTRDYGVREYGFILDTTLLLELLSKEENKEKVKEFLDWLEVDKIEDLDSIGLCDIAQEIGFSVYGQFTGKTYNYNGTDKEDDTLYFESDDMFIIFLQKDTLFQKYADWNEIFIEIINTLSSYGIKVDLDFVKKYTGEVNGSYWGVDKMGNLYFLDKLDLMKIFIYGKKAQIEKQFGIGSMKG